MIRKIDLLGIIFSSSSNQHSFRENNLPLTLPWLFFKIALWTIECLGKLISLLSLSPTFRFSSASRTLARQFIQFCYNYCFVISDLGYAWYMFFFIQQANLCLQDCLLVTRQRFPSPLFQPPFTVHYSIQFKIIYFFKPFHGVALPYIIDVLRPYCASRS